MCKLCWVISFSLIIISSYLSYKFVFIGAPSPSTDGRQEILLNQSERNIVLDEMRMFLSSVQKITDGISKDDMKIVVKAAHEVGLAAQQAVPASLAEKLPLSFKKLGFDTHRKFDALALDAEELGDTQYTLEQLSTLMNNCVSCHSIYKINSTLNK